MSAENSDLYKREMANLEVDTGNGKVFRPAREASDRRDVYPHPTRTPQMDRAEALRSEQRDQRETMYSAEDKPTNLPVHADDGDGRLLAAPKENDFRRHGKARVKALNEDRAARLYAEGYKMAPDMQDEVAHMMGEGLKHVATWASDTATPKADAAVKANIMSAEARGVVSSSDAVNLPAHYARYKIEPIRFLVENFGPVILVGKVVKYTMRYDAKNGLEDIAKAARCLHMLGEYVKGNADWWKRDS